MKNSITPIFLSLLAAFMIPLATGCTSGAGGHAEEEGHHHEHEGEESEVELSQKQLDAVGIKLGTFEQKPLAEALQVAGELTVNPQDEAVVAPLSPGIITKICVTEGQQVKAGQVIAYIESTELPLLQQQYLTAVAEEKRARMELERQEALAAQGAGVKKNLDNARSALSVAEIQTSSAAARLRQLGVTPSQNVSGASRPIPVKAEISGTVTAVTAKTGAFADMQAPVATIVNNRAVFVTLRVFEKDLPGITVGQSVTMQLTNNPSCQFDGVVTELTGALDPQTKTVAVKVRPDISNPGILLPGMAVSAVISRGEQTGNALPESAVVSSGDKHFIFVLEDIHDENGEKMYHFEKVEVVCGPSYMGYVGVTPVSELKEDAKIVTSNAFYLNSMASDHGEHNH